MNLRESIFHGFKLVLNAGFSWKLHKQIHPDCFSQKAPSLPSFKRRVAGFRQAQNPKHVRTRCAHSSRIKQIFHPGRNPEQRPKSWSEAMCIGKGRLLNGKSSVTVTKVLRFLVFSICAKHARVQFLEENVFLESLMRLGNAGASGDPLHHSFNSNLVILLRKRAVFQKSIRTASEPSTVSSESPQKARSLWQVSGTQPYPTHLKQKRNSKYP